MKSEKELKFDRIYKENRKHVLKVVGYHSFSRYSGRYDNAIVDDMAQDVWTKVWQNIDNLNESKYLKYYVGKMAMFHVINYFNNNNNRIFCYPQRVGLLAVENMSEEDLAKLPNGSLVTELSDEEFEKTYYEKYINPYLTDTQLLILDCIKQGYEPGEILKEVDMTYYYYYKELKKIKEAIAKHGQKLYFLEVDEF